MAGAKGIKAGRAFVELGVDDKLQAGLRRAQRRLKAFGAAVSSVGAGMMKIGALAVAPLLASAKVFASMGDSIAKMAKRTGFGVEALSTLQFAASQSGTSIEAFEKGVKRMATTIFDAGRGLSTAVDALTALGLTYEDLKGLAPEDQFKLLAERLSKVKDATTKAAVASMIFGRAGTAMLPMIAEGAKGIDDLQKKARELGLELSTEDAEAAEKFTDVMDVMGKVIKMAAFKLGAVLVPSLTKAAKWVTETTRRVGDWIKKNQDLIVSIVKWGAGLAGVGAALLVVGKGIAILAGAVKIVGAIMTATRALGGVISGTMIPVLAAFAAAWVTVEIAALRALAAGKAIERSSRERQKLDGEGKKLAGDLAKAEDPTERLRLYKKLQLIRERQVAIAEADVDAADAKAERLKSLSYLARVARDIENDEWEDMKANADRQAKQDRVFLAHQEKKLKTMNEMVESVEALAKVPGAPAGPGGPERAAEAAARSQQETADRQRRQRADFWRKEMAAVDELRRKHDEIAAGDLAQTRTNEELKLRLTKKGHALEVALLKLRRKWALIEAKGLGLNLHKVREEFDLRKKILEAGKTGVAKATEKMTVGVRGTFSARALWGLGGGKAADRTAKATEETAKNTKKILGRRTTGEPVFY